MKEIRDALGYAVEDHLNGRAVIEIVERENGFISTTGPLAAMWVPRFHNWSLPGWAQRFAIRKGLHRLERIYGKATVRFEQV